MGYSGTGNFTQSGGTNTVVNYLDIGNQFVNNPASVATYSLSGTGQLSAQYEKVGMSGTGNFTQSGGTNTISGALMLGGSSSGTYSLSSSGLLSAPAEYVGDSGPGNFTQSGGTNTILLVLSISAITPAAAGPTTSTAERSSSRH